MRRPRPTSIAISSSRADLLFGAAPTNFLNPKAQSKNPNHDNQSASINNNANFTWDEVKRMLDPNFKSRTGLEPLSRHQSTATLTGRSQPSVLNSVRLSAGSNCDQHSVRSSGGGSIHSSSPVSVRHNNNPSKSGCASALTTPTQIKRRTINSMENASVLLGGGNIRGRRTLSMSSTTSSGGQNTDQHIVVSRTASNQSSESSSSNSTGTMTTPKRRQKSWHESERL